MLLVYYTCSCFANPLSFSLTHTHTHTHMHTAPCPQTGGPFCKELIKGIACDYLRGQATSEDDLVRVCKDGLLQRLRRWNKTYWRLQKNYYNTTIYLVLIRTLMLYISSYSSNLVNDALLIFVCIQILLYSLHIFWTNDQFKSCIPYTKLSNFTSAVVANLSLFFVISEHAQYIQLLLPVFCSCIDIFCWR